MPSIPRLDPDQVVTAEACGECHASTFEVWKDTKHATGFQTTHRQQNAYDIANRMGFRLIKRDSMCLDCHYTPIEDEGRDGERLVRAASGVSCESCHGAGKAYIDIHNDYGGKAADGTDLDHTTESAEHRRQRIAASRAAGMRMPSSDLYAIVSSCFGCHMVPNEKLVNVGRHSLGTADFDLVSRLSQIRHNFLDSYLDGDGTVNAERSVQHQRRLAVLGRMLAVEYALRGMAEATEDGVYAKAMERRLRRTTSDLYQVARAANLDQAEQMVTLALDAPDGRDTQGARTSLLQAAGRVSELARAFETSRDGTRLAALDPLLDGGELPFVELPAREPDESEIQIADASGDPTATAGPSSGDVARAANTSANTSAPQVIPAQEAVPAEGETRSHIRPPSSHGTLEATACQKCHGDQNAWWFNDRHYASIEPFLDRESKNVRIARLYGISPSQMARGDSLCMDCHGTVATARAAREVEDGVSCQSCHGAAADYLEIHQAEEGEALGPNRPGYRQALQNGMKDLRDLPVAVANCASCHYVTDRRLLSSGHPSGEDFDIVSSISKIKHWQTAVHPDAELRQAWAAVQSQQGPVPEVRLARLATPARTVTPTQTATRAETPSASGPTTWAATSEAGESEEFDAGWEPRTTRSSTQDRSDARGEPVELSERPELGDLPVDERLRRIQQRLEELYRASGGTARSQAEQDDAEDDGGGP